MVHHLKILPEYFREVQYNRKTFEVRSIKDREFHVGDTIMLHEWDGEYTGKIIERRITYILDNLEYVKEGYVIMSMAPLGEVL